MKRNFMICVVLFVVAVLFQTIVYSVLSRTLYINGIGYARVSEEIRISGMEVYSTSNNSSQLYDCEYSKNTIKVGVSLPALSSEIVYKIRITNFSSESKQVDRIEYLVRNNANIDYEVNYNTSNEIGAGVVKEIFITFKYSESVSSLSNINGEMTLAFFFKKKSNIISISGDGSKLGDQVQIGTEKFHVLYNDGETLTLFSDYAINKTSNLQTTSTTPSSDGYTSISFYSSVFWGGLTYEEPYPTVYATINSLFTVEGTGTNDSNHLALISYVDAYGEYIKSFDVDVVGARLLEWDDMELTDCTSSTCGGSSYPWMRSGQVYMTGSASSSSQIWVIDANGNVNSSTAGGIRPVLVISL